MPEMAPVGTPIISVGAEGEVPAEPATPTATTTSAPVQRRRPLRTALIALGTVLVLAAAIGLGGA